MQKILFEKFNEKNVGCTNQFTDHDLRGHIGSSEGASLENVRWNTTDC